jgi:hypothetical protein
MIGVRLVAAEQVICQRSGNANRTLTSARLVLFMEASDDAASQAQREAELPWRRR